MVALYHDPALTFSFIEAVESCSHRAQWGSWFYAFCALIVFHPLMCLFDLLINTMIFTGMPESGYTTSQLPSSVCWSGSRHADPIICGPGSAQCAEDVRWIKEKTCKKKKDLLWVKPNSWSNLFGQDGWQETSRPCWLVKFTKPAWVRMSESCPQQPLLLGGR